MRPLTVLAPVTVLALGLAACGDDDDSNDTTAGAAGADADAASNGGFCDSVEGIEDDFAIFEEDPENIDPATLSDQIATATERFTSVDPPEEIAEDWHAIADLFTLLFEAEDPANMEGEEAFASVLTIGVHVDRVAAYIQDECDVDLGVSAGTVTDSCSLADEADLSVVFPDGVVPEPEGVPFGGDTNDCVWEGEDDDFNVGVATLPAEDLQSDVLDTTQPLATVTIGDVEGQMIDGVYGIGRFGGGRTISFVKGDIGLLVSVRMGGFDADRDVEEETATSIAESVYDALP